MTDTPQTNPPAPNWLRRWGRRNLAYIAFVAVLIPAANVLEASGPQGPDSGGGMMLGLIVWALVSLVFFVWNAILLIAALVRNGNALKPFIACLLPILIIVGVLVTEDLFA